MPENQKTYGFPKTERIKSRKTIERLFERNRKAPSFMAYPYRVVVLQDDIKHFGFPEVLISVSKKRFKRAVDRNRIKRLTREAYRLQKPEVRKKTYLAFIFVGKEIPDLETCKQSLSKVIKKMDKDGFLS